MNILILAATAFELNSVKEGIRKIKNNKSEKLKLKNKKIEKFKNLNFSFFCTGIGNFEVILNLTKYLENIEKSEKNKKPDFILNLGICGYQNLENKNFIQVGRIFGVAKEKEFLVPQFINFGEISSVYSSEKIIYKIPNLETTPEGKEITCGENYFEMESFGIEYVLEKTGIPRAYFKFPFDKIGGETVEIEGKLEEKSEKKLEKNIKKTGENKTINFKQSLPEIKKILQENIDYKKLFLKIENFLEKNSNKIFENKFQNELKFLEKNSDKIGNLTFQDKNNFEKLFFKYETLANSNKENLNKENSEKILEKLKKFFLPSGDSKNEENPLLDEKKNHKIKKNILIEKINSEIEKFLV